MTATCNKCGQEKPLEAFSKCSTRPRGVQSRCKDCLRTKRCADCGTPITASATYCMACRFKGERNPIAGTTRPEFVKQAVSRAQKGVPEPPRTRKTPKNPHVGRGQANSMFTKPGACERCGERKRLDWHHVNGDATDNRRGNLMALCRRCHQITDGRHEFVSTVMPKMGRRAQLHPVTSNSAS